MKQCPKCRSTYTDDGLRFCLTDGSELTPVADEQATLVAGRGRTVPDRPHGGHGTAGRGSIGKVLAIVGVLGIFLIVAVVAFVLVIYVGVSRSKMSDTGNGNRNAPISAEPRPTPDNEKQRLQDELANVQKRLAEDEKNANRAVSSQPTPNSPGRYRPALIHRMTAFWLSDHSPILAAASS